MSRDNKRLISRISCMIPRLFDFYLDCDPDFKLISDSKLKNLIMSLLEKNPKMRL